MRRRRFAFRTSCWQRQLVLFTESLEVSLVIWIKELLAALLPCSLNLGRRDVPVRPAFHADGAQVLTELLHRRSTEEPVAAVDLVDDETGLEHNHMRDHGIVHGISVLGDVEILLKNAPRTREERQRGADTTGISVGLREMVGAYRHRGAKTHP